MPLRARLSTHAWFAWLAGRHVRIPPDDRKEKLRRGRMLWVKEVHSRKVQVVCLCRLWSWTPQEEGLHTRQGRVQRVRGLRACVCIEEDEMRPRHRHPLRVRGLRTCIVILQEVMRPRQGHALQVQTARTLSLLLQASLRTPNLRLRVMGRGHICAGTGPRHAGARRGIQTNGADTDFLAC